MYEPTRGGTRGGQAEFKWTDVSADKDREVRKRAWSPSFFSENTALSSVALPVVYSISTDTRPRITSATPSMLQQEGGRRTRIFIGTIEISRSVPKRRKKSYDISERRRRRLSPSLCTS
jgi:hypothetical protein